MIKIEQLYFTYPNTGFSLRLPEFHVASGEKLAIVGPSGAGKTTLLKLLSGILKPQSGNITVDGALLNAMGEAERRNFRIARIGFVFQELELLDYLNVSDNILHTYRINPVLKLDRRVRQRAENLAREVGLDRKLHRMPRELSLGERQRVAVCRALLPAPSLIFADEATGSLDPDNKLRILDRLFGAADSRKASLVAVTHDHELLPRFDRVLDIRRLVS
ncbi:MAG: ABC transporter ATP-binding protein [Gammaproteobacteria bacterium]